ncbi:MAG: pyridoxamine 5'-phosphate oxidase family protein [Halobacteriales archaeon]|nr:pyridoxamine 5'-phosphate oxidase family protein [Halobacteriales archaeon]
MQLSGAWSRDELDAFLTSDAGTVPLRLACHTPDGGLWMLSLWYRWRDGGLDCATSANADIVEYLRTDRNVSFEVSVNEPPYFGVRGSGRATLRPDEEMTLLRSLLERYLGGTDSELAGRLLSDEREEIHIRIEPAKLYTWDFSDRM